ncbi:peroxiredoxin [Marinobacter fonticola]|uniref:peroxiredoxin n=1 Tax=Marinobacter fonticola TaxID=2603215 RepID=UPI0011E6CB7C|nr:peroxiredoxin [Marinobacter fonticola]
MTRHTRFSEDLPVPADDGACVHLDGAAIPAVALPGTHGETIDLSALSGLTVIYCYPRIGDPNTPAAPGWADIPGAKGCTPQACDFRDHHDELTVLGASVFGVSAQPLDEQKAAVERLGLTFPLLHDSDLALANALTLPTFEFNGTHLIKRLTLIAVGGVIQKVFYPVFPPDQHAEAVVAWVRDQRIEDG